MKNDKKFLISRNPDISINYEFLMALSEKLENIATNNTLMGYETNLVVVIHNMNCELVRGELRERRSYQIEQEWLEQERQEEEWREQERQRYQERLERQKREDQMKEQLHKKNSIISYSYLEKNKFILVIIVMIWYSLWITGLCMFFSYDQHT